MTLDRLAATIAMPRIIDYFVTLPSAADREAFIAAWGDLLASEQVQAMCELFQADPHARNHCDGARA